MFARVERRHTTARCHPMRRAGESSARDRVYLVPALRLGVASALMPRHDSGFVAHLVAEQLQAEKGLMLHDVAQHSAVLAYRGFVAGVGSAATYPTVLRRTA